MHVFDIPSEIRLKIYSELLVLSEPIVFVPYYTLFSTPLSRSERKGLCPALLRINKMIYQEANALLYSNNRFQFPEILFSTHPVTYIAHIDPFLHQIGSQASHIRHICIPFPTFDYTECDSIRLQKHHINNWELIRDTCTSIRTLELLVSPDIDDYVLSDPSSAAQALFLLNTHFEDFPSLKEILINFEVYPEQEPSGDLTKIHDFGWTVKVTELPKKTWVSDDGRVEFDTYEECEAYDEEQLLISERQRQREEEEE